MRTFDSATITNLEKKIYAKTPFCVTFTKFLSGKSIDIHNSPFWVYYLRGLVDFGGPRSLGAHVVAMPIF